jgi:hypothetical protein
MTAKGLTKNNFLFQSSILETAASPKVQKWDAGSG